MGKRTINIIALVFVALFAGAAAIHGAVTGSVLTLGKWGHWSALHRAENATFYALSLGLWVIVAGAAVWYLVAELRKRP